MKIVIVVFCLIALCLSQDCKEEMVECFQAPCASSKCDVIDAKCTDDYCGGCNARWTDPKGNAVCVPPEDPCATVDCAEVVCDEGYTFVVPEGKCCGTCQKDEVDCSTVKCAEPVCEDGYYPVTKDGQCCAECVEKPDSCDVSACPAVICDSGKEPITVDGQCCPNCDTKPTGIDCSTVKCAYPNCAKGEIAYQPEGKCCLECKEGCDKVECFADPCSVSKCDVEDAVCHSDYCGGCNAIWKVKDTVVSCTKLVGDEDDRTKFFSYQGDATVDEAIEKLEAYFKERGIEVTSITRGEDGKITVVFSTATDADVGSRAVQNDADADFIVVEKESSSVVLTGLSLFLIAVFA